MIRNRLTQDAPTLFMNQYGDTLIAASLKELRERHETRYGERGRVGKQYVDKKSGGAVWNGYVIGRYWYTAFKWAEVAA